MNFCQISRLYSKGPGDSAPPPTCLCQSQTLTAGPGLRLWLQGTPSQRRRAFCILQPTSASTGTSDLYWATVLFSTKMSRLFPRRGSRAKVRHFFLKGQKETISGFERHLLPYSHCTPPLLCKGSHRWYVNKRAWLWSKKTLFRVLQFELHVIFICHKIFSSVKNINIKYKNCS